MTDWKERQRTCKKCDGLGYRQSDAKHEDGRGRAWAVLCECQPKTMKERAEAAAQERAMGSPGFSEP